MLFVHVVGLYHIKTRYGKKKVSPVLAASTVSKKRIKARLVVLDFFPLFTI